MYIKTVMNRTDGTTSISFIAKTTLGVLMTKHKNLNLSIRNTRKQNCTFSYICYHLSWFLPTDAALFPSGSIKTRQRLLAAPNSYRLKLFLRELMSSSHWPQVMGGNFE